MLTDKNLENSAVFPKGDKLESDNFSGQVWLKMLTVSPCAIGNVTFEPGCRNNWHRHTGGQILLVTGGSGYYQEWGQPARKLVTGDVVEIAPDVKHWHGAAHDRWFAHLSVTPAPDKNRTDWLEPVSEAEYSALA